MEWAIVFDFLADLPTFAWVVLVIGVLFFLGDTKLWDYEVKFPLRDGVGRGQVELECFKKKGTMIELRLQLEPQHNEKAIDVYVRDTLVYTLPKEKNRGANVYIQHKHPFDEPHEGDEVCLKIDDEPIFSGPLVLD